MTDNNLEEEKVEEELEDLFDYDPEVEEIDDVEIYDGDPDELEQVDEHGNQDELEEGEALGDDLAPAEEQEDTDA